MEEAAEMNVPATEREQPIFAADIPAGAQDIGESTRAKLKAEIASPFRKLRQFLYSAAGIAGALGTATSVPQLILASQGSLEKGSVGDIVLNIAIDVGAIVGSIILWDQDAKADKAKIEQFSQKERLISAKLSKEEANEREIFLSKLPVEIQTSEYDVNVTKVVSLGDLQNKGKQNVIIVTGTAAFIKDVLISARIEGSNLFTDKETYVVPVVYEEAQLEEEGSNRGFSSKETMMSAPYIGKPTQVILYLKCYFISLLHLCRPGACMAYISGTGGVARGEAGDSGCRRARPCHRRAEEWARITKRTRDATLERDLR
jgi:hypothetical protein